jgi:NAD(P)-dependent dehydrogenase (short-subunit alcohol dehydrogenase family)
MNIVITGASSGIGYQTALAFSATLNNRIICYIAQCAQT